jgi:multicomponent Na+:H+ antiporter subunit E
VNDLPIQILINLFIAFLWMFFQDQWNFLSFLGGYLVGIIILFFIRRFFDKPFYIFTFAAIIKLLIVFIIELLTSSFLVMRQVLRPKMNITPGIFRIETDMEGEMEVTMLALLLTLTPGSVVLEVTADSKAFYIHAMDIPESKTAVLKSKVAFEKAIKDVTRVNV